MRKCNCKRYVCIALNVCFRYHALGMESEHCAGPVLHPNWASGQAGVVTLLHDIIITADEPTRVWFAQYLKCMQQKVSRHGNLALCTRGWLAGVITTTHWIWQVLNLAHVI